MQKVRFSARQWSLALALALGPGWAWGQMEAAETAWGGMITLSDRWDLQRDWSVAGATEARLGDDLKPVLIDFTAIGERKIGATQRIGGGYLVRFSENEVMHRLVQQVVGSGSVRSWQVGYRARLDQNWVLQERGVYRGRVRLTGLRALQGQQLDGGEWYVKMGTEAMQWRFSDRWVTEGRGRIGLGFRSRAQSTLEIALDYRKSRVKDEMWINLQVYF